MSLDLYLKKTCETCGYEDEAWWGNYTHNVGGMWHRVYPGQKMVEIGGMTGRESIPVLAKVIDDMAANIDSYREMNPDNGWGSADGFLHFLKEARAAAERNPDFVWRACR